MMPQQDALTIDAYEDEEDEFNNEDEEDEMSEEEEDPAVAYGHCSDSGEDEGFGIVGIEDDEDDEDEAEGTYLSENRRVTEDNENAVPCNQINKNRIFELER